MSEMEKLARVLGCKSEGRKLLEDQNCYSVKRRFKLGCKNWLAVTKDWDDWRIILRKPKNQTGMSNTDDDDDDDVTKIGIESFFSFYSYFCVICTSVLIPSKWWWCGSFKIECNSYVVNYVAGRYRDMFWLFLFSEYTRQYSNISVRIHINIKGKPEKVKW